MIGPVLYLELLLAGRRGNQAVFRYLYGAWLLTQMFFLYVVAYTEYRQQFVRMAEEGIFDRSVFGRFSLSYLEILVIQQIIMVYLWVPTYAAGAITDEKTRGTLQYLLTADLTAGEVVLGKLLGRMAQVALLLIADMPLIAFFGVFGGLGPLLMLAITGTSLILLFAAASASVLASVWCRQTRDAVLCVYGGVLIWFILLSATDVTANYLTGGATGGANWGFGTQLVLAFNSFLNLYRPLRVLEPAFASGDGVAVARRFVGSFLAWGAFGGICLAIATLRMRAAYTRQLENSGNRKQYTAAFARGPINDEPIRWKEQEVEGIAPLPALRQVRRWLALTLVVLVTIMASCVMLWLSREPKTSLATVWDSIASFNPVGLAKQFNGATSSPAFLSLAVLATLIASLAVGIRCSGTISGERERQTWEALLLTPLETRQLVRGKLWGIFGAAVPYFVAYAIPAMLLSLLAGIAAFFWVLLFLPVTALAMYYVGAAGLYCSVRSRSSWRSLLGTLGVSYVGGFVAYLVTTPAVFIIAGVVRYIVLPIIDQVLQEYGIQSGLTVSAGSWGIFDDSMKVAWVIASCASLAAIFYLVSWYFMVDAEAQVANRERTRHWKDEALLRTRPRRLPVPTPQPFRR